MTNEKLHSRSEILKQAIGELIEQESNKTSMISITQVLLSSDAKYATVYVSIFPTSSEDSALNFLKRLRPEMKSRAKKVLKSNLIPFIDVTIDQGEKNRQKIEELIRKTK